MRSEIDAALAVEQGALKHQNAMNAVMGRGNSEIQHFYRDATIFITGGSGFLGKQLIEKLLRSCNIKKIFILLRPKKGKAVLERLNSILDDQVYESLLTKQPGFVKRLVPIEGNVADIGLGINELDRKTITEQVDIIFHLAATIRFDEPIRVATLTNVRGTREVLALARECTKLRSFVYVSTAYSHATSKNIGTVISEKFYPCPVQPEDLIRMAETDEQDKMKDVTLELIKEWPNTYTFTKALAEELVRTSAKNLPACVIRPPIVACSYYEPMPGWLDLSCVLGTSGILVGVGVGILHAFYLEKPKNNMAIVPVDLVNNGIIAAAWDSNWRRCIEGQGIEVYTMASEETGMTWDFMRHMMENEGRSLASPKAVWYCFTICTKNKAVFWILSRLLHYIPAYFLDGICAVMGRKPKGIKSFVKIYTTIEKYSALMNYFINNEFRFRDENVQAMLGRMSAVDKSIYNCDIRSTDYREYLKVWAIGVRKYIFKDGLKNTAKGIKKQKMFRIINYFFGLVYVYVMWQIINWIWIVLKFVFWIE